MIFHEFITIFCMDCNHRINVPVFCGDRFCSVCSEARRNRIRHRIEFLLNNVQLEPGMRIKHLTLTIPNSPDLPGMLKTLVAAFRKLRHTSFWKNKVAGGCFVLEVTGREGDWHGHIHAIINARFIQWETLRNLWIRFSKGRGVWLSVIPKAQAIKYLTKYLSKPDLPEACLSAVNSALKGYRMFQPFGTWYKLSAKYEKPMSKCFHCGSEHSFELYALYYGGQIRRYMDVEEAQAGSPRPPPTIALPFLKAVS